MAQGPRPKGKVAQRPKPKKTRKRAKDKGEEEVTAEGEEAVGEQEALLFQAQQDEERQRTANQGEVAKVNELLASGQEEQKRGNAEGSGSMPELQDHQPLQGENAAPGGTGAQEVSGSKEGEPGQESGDSAKGNVDKEQTSKGNTERGNQAGNEAPLQGQEDEPTDDGFTKEDRAVQIAGEEKLKQPHEDERAKRIIEEKTEEDKTGLIFAY